MAIKKYTVYDDQQLTEEQIRMVQEAAKRPIEFDEDSPELTDEQLAAFRRVHEVKR